VRSDHREQSGQTLTAYGGRGSGVSCTQITRIHTNPIRTGSTSGFGVAAHVHGADDATLKVALDDTAAGTDHLNKTYKAYSAFVDDAYAPIAVVSPDSMAIISVAPSTKFLIDARPVTTSWSQRRWSATQSATTLK
jgi:hypothetical protein